jgi:anti-sigma-K factor RskA
MTEPVADHTDFDELAAGYAVDALEPADEQRFLRHAAGCPDCLRSMAEFQAVAAALAETAPFAEPSDELGLRILAATRPDRDTSGQTAPGGGSAAPAQPADGQPADVVPLGPRAARRQAARRRQRWVVAAAAAAVIVAGGTWAGLDATSGNSPSPLAVCTQPHKCSEITLVAAQTHQVAGKVVVLDGKVWMQPTDMSANATDQIYVLWQITGNHAPLAIGSFDVTTGVHAAIKIGGLAAPYSGTESFAVSLEHGQTIPPAPSRVVAAGQVS